MIKKIKEKINLLLPLSILAILLVIGCSSENLNLGINESNNESLKNEINLQLKQDIESLEKENEKLRANLSSLNSEVAKLKQTNLELESKIKNLDLNGDTIDIQNNTTNQKKIDAPKNQNKYNKTFIRNYSYEFKGDVYYLELNLSESIYESQNKSKRYNLAIGDFGNYQSKKLTYSERQSNFT